MKFCYRPLFGSTAFLFGVCARAFSPNAPKCWGRVKALILTAFMSVIIPIKITVFCWMPVREFRRPWWGSRRQWRWSSWPRRRQILNLAQELEGNTQSKYIAPEKRLNKVVGLAKNAIVAQLVYNKFNAIKPMKKNGWAKANEER